MSTVDCNRLATERLHPKDVSWRCRALRSFDGTIARATAIATPITQGPQGGHPRNQRSGLAFERMAFGLLFDGADKTEGISEVLEKRSPRFG